MKCLWYTILLICAHKGHNKNIQHAILPCAYVHTSNDDEENYIGKYMELILAQGVSKEPGHSITKQENYLLSY